jgi:hypothetical protein
MVTERMSKRSGYLFYEAGQAVAAAHLGLTIKRITGNPAEAVSEIVIPRGDLKARLILWLTAIAAESKGAGQSAPLRRMRNRQRVRAYMEAMTAELPGSPAKRQAAAARLRAQAQDRANAICTDLHEVIEQLAEKLETQGFATGTEVHAIVAAFKDGRDGRKHRGSRPGSDDKGE